MSFQLIESLRLIDWLGIIVGSLCVFALFYSLWRLESVMKEYDKRAVKTKLSTSEKLALAVIPDTDEERQRIHDREYRKHQAIVSKMRAETLAECIRFGIDAALSDPSKYDVTTGLANGMHYVQYNKISVVRTSGTVTEWEYKDILLMAAVILSNRLGMTCDLFYDGTEIAARVFDSKFRNPRATITES